MYPGTVSIAAAVTENGVQLYTKTTDGALTGQRNSITDSALQAAKQAKDKTTLQERAGWSTFVYTSGMTSPGSKLAAFAWGGPEEAAKSTVFYEQPSGTICYATFAATQSGNIIGDLSGTLPTDGACTPGSQLAVIGIRDGTVIFLFYQDSQDDVVYRRAMIDPPRTKFMWDSPIRLTKAVKGSGISAVNDAFGQIHLFYQDSEYSIHEMLGDFFGQWSAGSSVATCSGLSPITCVGWTNSSREETVRIYYHPNGWAINERCWSRDKGWYIETDRIVGHLEGTDHGMAAFIRAKMDGDPVLTFWASSIKQDLHQRVYTSSLGWIDYLHTRAPIPV